MVGWVVFRLVFEVRVKLSFLFLYCLFFNFVDDGSDFRRDVSLGIDFREYCMFDRDIVEVVRTEYVYTRFSSWSDTLFIIYVVTFIYSRFV